MAENSDSLGSMIEKAMADPRFGEIFGMLKEKADKGELDVSSVGSLLGGASGTEEKAEEKMKKSEKSEKSENGKRRDFSKHERLLYALKPYLSDSKKNAVDTVVKAAKLGDILEVLGGTSKTP